MIKTTAPKRQPATGMPINRPDTEARQRNRRLQYAAVWSYFLAWDADERDGAMPQGYQYTEWLDLVNAGQGQPLRASLGRELLTGQMGFAVDDNDRVTPSACLRELATRYRPRVRNAYPDAGLILFYDVAESLLVNDVDYLLMTLGFPVTAPECLTRPSICRAWMWQLDAWRKWHKRNKRMAHREQ